MACQDTQVVATYAHLSEEFEDGMTEFFNNVSRIKPDRLRWIKELDTWDGFLHLSSLKKEGFWYLNFEDIEVFFASVYHFYESGLHLENVEFDVGNGNFCLQKKTDRTIDIFFIENDEVYFSVKNLEFNTFVKFEEGFLRTMHSEFCNLMSAYGIT